MKLEIEFDNVGSLKQQLVKFMEDLEPSVSTPVFNDEDVQEEPSLPSTVSVDTATVPDASTSHSVESQVTATIKRRRKTKADLQADMVPKTKELVSKQPATVEEALTQTPKNFYSLTDFLNNFAVILNQLVKDATLSHENLTEYCTYFKVPFIYALSKDKKKMEEFYNGLVSQGHITKKGDY